MRRRNQSQPVEVPELERVELTPEEEQSFSQIVEGMLPGTEEETKRFLESHRHEAQGQ